MEKLSSSIIKYRWLILLVVVALTVFLGLQIRNLQINSDVVESLPDDDPSAVLFRKIGQEFGINKMGMIILETNDIFSNEVISHVNRITDSLSEINGVASVTSLTNIVDIRKDEMGFEMSPMVDPDNLPLTDDQLQKLRDRVLNNDLYKGVVVSDDATATVIVFNLYDNADIQKEAEAIKNMVDSMHLPEKVYYAGLPMMVMEIADLISTDLIRLIPIAFLVIALVLLVSFRSGQGVFLPLLTSSIAIVWTIGIMALFGFKMSMVTNNIPILLLAVGNAYTIHVINKINQVRERDMKKAIIIALAYIFVPVSLAALTTIIGFTSFVFEAYFSMIKDFGIFAALGTFFSAILALFFAPVMIWATSSRRRKLTHLARSKRDSVVTRYILFPLNTLLFKHPRYTLVTWGILILLSIAAGSMISRDVDIKDYFRKDNPARKAEDIMIDKFGGSKPIFILFDGDMQSPEVLNTMLKAEEVAKADPYVTNAQSVADLVVELYDALGEGRRIPDTEDKVQQLWFLLDGNPAMSQFVNSDLTEGVVLSKFSSADNKAIEAFANRMNEFVKEHSSDDLKISLTGMPFIYMKINDSLLSSQIRSIIIATIALVLVVALILRSWGAGFQATAPIIAAIILLFGVMGISGIPLNIVTVLVASIALGIGIDYSIHVLSQFKHSFRNGRSLDQSLADTIMISGKAIVINVVSVSLGFLVLIFSKMVPLAYFGILMAFSMIASGLAALTLLPVILVLVYEKKIPDGSEIPDPAKNPNNNTDIKNHEEN